MTAPPSTSAKELSRIFIANRGEIAVRIIRTAQRLGLGSVLGVSEADRNSVGARLADRSLCLGPAPSASSYLLVDTVVQAALSSGCDAIHPGYGFLAERADLARRCDDAGLTFIGATAEQLDAVGDKLRARAEAIAADVPVVPGGAADNVAEARALAERIGTPLLIKAVGGGGGRGMQRVDDLNRLEQLVEIASAEAGAAFGDPRIYVERLITHGRHIEVQVLGDGHGNVIHLGERDCSVQRRYQKLIEEAPAPNLPHQLRQRMWQAAVRFAQRLRYRGAGTVEFLYDLQREEFYFLEMNARIQVEHPVTEMLTGIDLIAEQIAVAAGHGLRVAQDDVTFTGAAIECRINAEDPARGFMPSPGAVTDVTWPTGEGIRVDTHIVPGAMIPPYYDSMIAKIIAHGPDRDTARRRLTQALTATRLTGVTANLDLHHRLLADPDFVHGGVDTGYLTRLLTHDEEITA